MTTTDPVDRLREAINSHDPRRVADCFTSDYRSETPHRPAEGFTGSDRVLANRPAGASRGRSGRWPARDRAACSP